MCEEEGGQQRGQKGKKKRTRAKRSALFYWVVPSNCSENSREWPWYCRKVYWTKMVQTTILVKMTLFRTGFLHSRDQNGPFWPKEVHDSLSGSNATALVSRYSCRATLVSRFSPCVFAVSHENRATPCKVSQERPCRTLLDGVSHLKLAMHISKNRVALQGVSQLQCCESRYTATLRVYFGPFRSANRTLATLEILWFLSLDNEQQS